MCIFSSEQVANAISGTLIERCHTFDTVASTNDEAKRIVALQRDLRPAMVIAKGQTQGRGRGGNTWVGGRGALTFSLIIPVSATNVAEHASGLLSLWTAIGIRDALSAITGVDFVVKWPNDVYFGHRKIAGILIETLAADRVFVIGIGINVSNSEALDAAFCSASRPIALVQITDKSQSSLAVLHRVLTTLDSLWDGSPLPDLRAAWAPHCLLNGRRVVVAAGDRRIAGLCHSVDAQGALLVQVGEQTERIFSGTVKVEP